MYSVTINPIYCFRVGFGKVTVLNFQDPSAFNPFLSRISGLLMKVGVGFTKEYCLASMVLAAFMALVRKTLPYNFSS